ncbi:MAG: AAA family ATPase, partial [Fuerstiella sp.]|nr:AAA family ATPase [Fuerstiella sp.]
MSVVPTIQHTLQSVAGVAVVTGPSGVGKTVLLDHIQTLLARHGQAIILPGTSLKTTEDLYLCIQRSLKSQDGNLVNTAFSRWNFVERLQNSAEFWGPIALLIDDAHLMSPDLFTELKFLLEQRASSHPLCRLLLAGSHALEETLAQPAISEFALRIRTYTFLQPLRLAESVEYIRSRIQHAGGSMADCFDVDAVEAVVDAADGNPRCLNLLADESLVLAYQDGLDCVTLETVRAALSGLQHLPHTWNVSIGESSENHPDNNETSPDSWQISSDGVIELGAEPAPGNLELGQRSPSIPTVMVETQEALQLSTEYASTESIDTESIDTESIDTESIDTESIDTESIDA